MIYIVNESNQQLSMKADQEAGLTTLSVIVGDGIDLDVAATNDAKVATAIMERFEKAEVINNSTARFNFKLTDARTYIDRYAVEDATREQGVANMAKLITIPVDAELPERYSVAKDMIVVVHSADNVVEMNEDDLNGEAYTVRDEQNEFAVTVFVIKWYNWSKLRGPVNIYIDGTAAYTLSTKESNVTEGRMINSVKSLRKQQKKPNKSKK